MSLHPDNVTDFAQFWREHPEYDACPKGFAAYSVAFAGLAAGALNIQGGAKIDPRGDFVAQRLSVVDTTATNGAYSGLPLLVRIVNGSTGRPYANKKMELWALGASQLPTGSLPGYPFSWPLLFGRGTQWLVYIDNPAAIVRNVWITLSGVSVTVNEAAA